MRQFVVDCSVVAKWVLPEPDRASAMVLFQRYTEGHISLIAPDLLLFEFASLAARKVRRRELTVEEARRANAFVVQIAPRLIDARPSIQRSLDLSLELGVSFWDCVYLNLASERQCGFLTADKRLFRRVGGGYPPVTLLR